VELPGRPLALLLASAWGAVASGLVVIVLRDIAPQTGVGSILTVCGCQLDFQFIDFIPLLVSALALGNGE